MNAPGLSEMIERRKQAAERLTLFDVSLWLGRPAGFPLAEEMDLPALRQEMANYHIAGGLVSHWRGQSVSAQEGNAALVAATEASADSGLGIIMTALPLLPAEDGPLPGRGDRHPLLRGVRVFPRSHGFPLSAWGIGSPVRWLLDTRMPLFVRHTELAWPELLEFAWAFPDLCIVVESQPRKIIYGLRSLLPLMRECPNVHLEISNLTGPGFEVAVRTVGPERLLFGSFLPVNDPLVPIGILLDAELGEADRALIAGGNLRRLIGEAAS